MTVVLTGSDLTRDEVVRVARGREDAVIAGAALRRMDATREVVDTLLERGDAVYGLTTGVGAGKRRRLEAAQMAAESSTMLRAHLIGQGTPLPAQDVRAAMLVLANGFASGWPGVRPTLALHLLAALNEGRIPPVRRLGSVGQADLAPLADLADGVLLNFQLHPGEALASLSSNAVATGGAALALSDLGSLLDALDAAGAMSLEGFAANLSILHRAVGVSRPFPGLLRSLDRLRSLLDGSRLWQPGNARNLQDPLTFRSLPQVNGAARDGLSFAETVLAVELNASQGNPVIVAEEGAAISTANFDSAPLAMALDAVRIALAPALASSSERTVKLLDAPWSGLPRGLDPSGAGDGLSFLGIAVQSLAAEARLLAAPVSYELVSTAHAEGIEDRTAMTPLGVRRVAEMVELGARIAAVELVVGAQAVDVRRSEPIGGGAAEVRRLVRDRVAFAGGADPTPPDVERIVEVVRAGMLSSRPLHEDVDR
jgi:histidine ammonia-lyase